MKTLSDSKSKMFLLFWEMKLSSLKLKKAYKVHACLKITKPSKTGGKM